MYHTKVSVHENLIERSLKLYWGGSTPLTFLAPTGRYYSAFGDTNDVYNNMLPYGEYIQDQKEVEVDKAYIEELDKYIWSKVVVPGKYYIPVLAKVKLRKRYTSGNPIGE